MTRPEPSVTPDAVADAHTTASAARPTRAALLALASRSTLAMLVVVAGLTVTGAAPWPVGAAGPPTVPDAATEARSPAADADRDGVTHGALLAALGAGLRVADANLITAEVRGVGRTGADLRVVVDAPVAGGSDTATLLDTLRAAGVERARVRSILPSPYGVRVELDGEVRLSTVRSASAVARTVPADRAAVALADLVERSGAELLRLESPAEQGPIRLSVRAALPVVVRLLDALEEGPTAPARFEDLRAEVVGAGPLVDVHLSFHLREDDQPRATREVRP
jgi:hypothetical protein